MTAVLALYTEKSPPSLRGMKNITLKRNETVNENPIAEQISRKEQIDQEIGHLLERFRIAFKRTFDAQFEKGDIIYQVERLCLEREGRSPELKLLKQKYFDAHSISYLSKLRTTALAYSAEERARIRETGASFHDCYLAVGLRKRLIDKKQVPSSTPPSDIVEQVRRSTKRNTRAMAKQVAVKIKRVRDDRRMADFEETLRSAVQGSWTSNFLKKDCREMLGDEIKPGSVDLCWFDPPYLYPGGGRSSPCLSEVGLAEDADNTAYADALALQLDMIRRMPEYLSDQGVIVLWGAGGVPDDPQVIAAAYEAGFKYIFPLHWTKRTQAGHQYRGFATSSERILVLARNRETLFDNSPELPRGQNVNRLGERFVEDLVNGKIKSVTHSFARDIADGRAQPGDRSIYEKPFEICAGFMEKLTRPGDLVWDCCGCTGSMIESCLRLGRRWIYSETNDKNFALGFDRIKQLLDEHPELWSQQEPGSDET